MAYKEPRETVPNDVVRRRDVVDALNREAQRVPNQYDFHMLIHAIKMVEPVRTERNSTDQERTKPNGTAE